MQLHHETGELTPEGWLAKWLSTPFEELDGRKPAHFLDSPDYDLILVGLLVQLRTQSVWFLAPQTA